MATLAERIGDQRMLQVIRAFLRAGVMEDGLVSPVEEGTPDQRRRSLPTLSRDKDNNASAHRASGPLSPLLSNIVLDELDRELERRGHRFARYADDCNIYVRSLRAGQRVMESVTRFIANRLQLQVNSEKSAVAQPRERKFLGFSFTSGREPRRRRAPPGAFPLQRAGSRTDATD